MTKEFVIANLFNGQPAQLNKPIRLTLKIEGDNCRVDITAPYQKDPPPPAPKGRIWELWEHEVVEIFLVDENGRYIEAEFGPHGHYLLLLLSEPRQIEVADLPMKYAATIEGNMWTGHAEFKLTGLKRIDRVNCFAIYGRNHKRRYLAWSPVPGPEPDFHQPETFHRLH